MFVFLSADSSADLGITLVILELTWDSLRTVTTTEPDEPVHAR